MPTHPTLLPASVRQRLALCAVHGVQEANADYPRPDGETRRRRARLAALGALHADLAVGDGVGLDPVGRTKLRQGVGILIDAAEDVTHGVVGEITEAGIDAAQNAAGCNCGPTFVRILKGLVDLGVEAAFAGMRSAAGR